MANKNSGTRFAAVARHLLEEPNEEQTLDAAVALAVEMVTGCNAAAITIVHGTLFETPAATSDLVRRGDRLQYETNEGPCMDSLRKEQTTISSDLEHESRWPTWGPRVVEELGIRSMLCFQLFTDHETLGALNLYSTTIDAFNDIDQAIGLTLAAQIAVSLSATRKRATQSSGIISATTIGQAQGILMERYGLTVKLAFELMKRVSKDSKTEISQIAEELVWGNRLLPNEDH